MKRRRPARRTVNRRPTGARRTGRSALAPAAAIVLALAICILVGRFLPAFAR